MQGLLVNPLQGFAGLYVLKRHQGDGRTAAVDVNGQVALQRALCIVNSRRVEGEVHLQQSALVGLGNEILDTVGGKCRTHERDGDVVDAGRDVAAGLVGNNQDRGIVLARFGGNHLVLNPVLLTVVGKRQLVGIDALGR